MTTSRPSTRVGVERRQLGAGHLGRVRDQDAAAPARSARARRSSSRSATPARPAGWASRSRLRSCSSEQAARCTWIVLPRPMSSARQPPRPRLCSHQSQRKPDLLVGTQVGASAAPARQPAAPSGLRSPASAAPARLPPRPSTTPPPPPRREPRRRCRSRRRPAAATRRRTETAGGRLALRTPSSARAPGGASPDRPRPTAREPAPGRRWRRGFSRTSRAVSVSPSSVTAAEKSSIASAPRVGRLSLPTVTCTSGRGGLLARHDAGTRTTTPAASKIGNVLEKAMRLARRPGERLEDGAAVDELLRHGARLAPRAAPASSRASSAALLRAPAYWLRA